MRLLLLPLLILALPWPLLAANGVFEVNQTCAVAVGCFPGDAAGFPVTIATPGSYRLTGNLDTSPDSSVDAIEVAADGVTIDLNGFLLVGPVICTGLGSAVTCGGGTGRGIDAASNIRVVVKDGRVMGFASAGVRASHRALIDSVVSVANGGDGIRTGNQSIVRSSISHRNGQMGITAGAGSIVDRCVASSNRSFGILSDGSSITGNTSFDNGSHGIAGSACTMSRNSVTFGEGDGIRASGCVVSDNIASSNGGDGIDAALGSNVQRNVVRANGSAGLRLGSQTGYRENVITFDTIIGGVNMGANLCGTTICP